MSTGRGYYIWCWCHAGFWGRCCRSGPLLRRSTGEPIAFVRLWSPICHRDGACLIGSGVCRLHFPDADGGLSGLPVRVCRSARQVSKAIHDLGRDVL